MEGSARSQPALGDMAPHRSSSPSAGGLLRGHPEGKRACKAAPQHRPGVPGLAPGSSVGWAGGTGSPGPGRRGDRPTRRRATPGAGHPPHPSGDLWAGRGGSVTVEPAYVRRGKMEAAPLSQARDTTLPNLRGGGRCVREWPRRLVRVYGSCGGTSPVGGALRVRSGGRTFGHVAAVHAIYAETFTYNASGLARRRSFSWGRRMVRRRRWGAHEAIGRR